MSDKTEVHDDALTTAEIKPVATRGEADPMPAPELTVLPALAKRKGGDAVRLGQIYADRIGFTAAIEAIIDQGLARRGGFVVTPNVDHVCMAETEPRLRAAYDDAFLSLIDGTPLVWLARAMGTPVPAKISGSDLILPLLERCAQRGLRVYFLGGAPAVTARAKEVLEGMYPGLKVVGIDSPPIGFDKDVAQNQDVLARLNAAEPHIVLVALGCPKQEYWMHTNHKAFAPAMALGIGASLDFVAGAVKRAPHILSVLGLEWLFRLAQEPKRLFHRYLVRDRAIVGIAWRMLHLPKAQRIVSRD